MVKKKQERKHLMHSVPAAKKDLQVLFSKGELT
jgi:hypothetical protein